MKYVYLTLSVSLVIWNALSMTYIADKYYQLGQADAHANIYTEWAKRPTGTCFVKGGCE